jgi:hypothetical protein
MEVPAPTRELVAAMRAWQRRLNAEPALFRPGLPLNNAFLSPDYLTDETKLKVTAEIREQLNLMPADEADKDTYYLYTLHDPTLACGAWQPLELVCPMVDRHTRFRIFLSSLFYIGKGKRSRDSEHLTEKCRDGLQGGNPKKQDRIERVERRGGEVVIHRFLEGINRDQSRFLEALALRATRLAGNVANLKEEKVRGAAGGADSTPFAQQLAGTLVLWEASLTLGRPAPPRKVWTTPKKFSEAPRHAARVSVQNAEQESERYLARRWQRREELAMVACLLALPPSTRPPTRGVWEAMVEQGAVAPHRAWSQVRRHFLLHVLPNVHTLGLAAHQVERLAKLRPASGKRSTARRTKGLAKYKPS